MPLTGSHFVLRGPPHRSPDTLLSIVDPSPVCLSIRCRPPPHSPALKPTKMLVGPMYVDAIGCMGSGREREVEVCLSPTTSMIRRWVSSVTVPPSRLTAASPSPFVETLAVVVQWPSIHLRRVQSTQPSRLQVITAGRPS